MDLFKLYFVLLVKSHIKSYPCPLQILIQHIIKFSFLLEKSIMDGVYVIFILVEHHFFFFFYFFILEEVWLMVWQFIIFFFLFLKLCFLYPSFGHLFILYLLQLAAFVLEKVSI